MKLLFPGITKQFSVWFIMCLSIASTPCVWLFHENIIKDHKVLGTLETSFLQYLGNIFPIRKHSYCLVAFAQIAEVCCCLNFCVFVEELICSKDNSPIFQLDVDVNSTVLFRFVLHATLNFSSYSFQWLEVDLCCGIEIYTDREDFIIIALK